MLGAGSEMKRTVALAETQRSVFLPERHQDLRAADLGSEWSLRAV